MSTPGKLALWVPESPISELALYRELVLNWLLAALDRVPLLVCAQPQIHQGLAWMGLDFETAPPTPPRGKQHRRIRSRLLAEEHGLTILPVGELRGGHGVSLDSLQRAGFIPEVVLSALAQSGWRGRSSQFTNVTRSELLIRFSVEGLLSEPVDFDRAQWEELNRDRLHELAPCELLDLLNPFLTGPLPPRSQLEAAVMMHCEEVDNLVELASAIRG